MKPRWVYRSAMLLAVIALCVAGDHWLHAQYAVNRQVNNRTNRGSIRYSGGGARSNVQAAMGRPLPSENRFNKWTSGMLPSERRGAAMRSGMLGSSARILPSSGSHGGRGSIRYPRHYRPAGSPVRGSIHYSGGYVIRPTVASSSPYTRSYASKLSRSTIRYGIR